jgi:ATP phosphoribosyltransferase regulatory subunit
MSPDNRQRLRTPQGTESFFLEEAYRHRQLLRMTEDHFASWGYLPVLTPVFDYFETYRPLLNRTQEERSYRFPDREGELLMLRSDITLFLAKQMGLSLKDAPLPRRVYYADSILRHQEEEDISSDEFFQSGAELIGLSGREGDLEVLMLLHDLLLAMRLPTWRMHIGSRAILDAVIEGKCDPAIAGELLELRDRDALCRLFSEAGLNHCDERAQLLLFLGTPQEFSEISDKLVKACGETPGITEISAAVENLKTLASELSATAPMDNIRIDLSEHGGQPYYTGFTVRAYVEGANSAIASGGRYDNLLGSFGSPAAAAGFSLMMRKIEPLSEYAADAAEETPVTPAVGVDFTTKYKDAVRRRQNGERVSMTKREGKSS